VLHDIRKFVGKNIAVIGRAESDESGLGGLFLAEDNCLPPVQTGEFVWPTKLWIDCCDSFVPNSAEKLFLDETALRIKLSQIRRSTPLLTRTKITLKVDGDIVNAVGRHEAKDSWEVAYGRIEISDHLGRTRRVNRKPPAGFGDPPVAPAKIVLRLYPRSINDEDAPN
jgi:hypothetical protein